MLKLNLVPEIIKERMEINRVYLALKGMSFMFIFLFVFLAIIYTVTAIFLDKELSYISTESPLETAAEKKYTERPKEINQHLKRIENIQAESFSYITLLKNINDYIPSGINLSNLTISTQDNTLKLTGVATTRQDLLEIQKQLEQAPFLSDIEMPLQNFLEKTMIQFSVNAKLNSGLITTNQS